MKIIFATHNQGKLIEMKKILSDLEVVGLKDIGITEEIIEDGATFEENALKKARYANKKTKKWTIADDSGLCIVSLGGAPGVKSARWAGVDATSNDLVNLTLKRLKDIPIEKRNAYFESAAVLISPEGTEWTFNGRINGSIAIEPRGEALPNLPYDVIFIPEGINKTFAEIPENEKNSMSHRGKAFEKLRKKLITIDKPKKIQ